MEDRLYKSNLTDLEWQQIEPLLPSEKPVGREREVDLRAVVNAILYRADENQRM
ncbi:MAG: transposase [Hydrococcus sp. C42_A2020_068]|nr:transposase [Hydrococcus sp. C42_A2020_068]